jgi:myosin heavy subunit
MEAVRISNAGYPLRRTFGEFVDNFWPLAPEIRAPRMERRRAAAAAAAAAAPDAAASLAAADSGPVEREAAVKLLHGLVERDSAMAEKLREGADWQVGHSLVFMRAGASAALARALATALHASAARAQAGWRGHVARKEARRQKAAAVTLQAGARGMAARAEARRRREDKAAARLQAAWRGRVARRALRRAQAAATAIQAAARGRAARVRAAELRRAAAAVKLQAAWRGRAARAAFAPRLRAHRAAVKIQRAYRGHKVRHPRYSKEQVAAVRALQAAWRDRDAIKSHARQLRLRNAFTEYAGRWHAAITMQTAWRAHRAQVVAFNIREEMRRARFRSNAAMFRSMAATGGGPKPPGPPGGNAGAGAAAFKITANGGPGAVASPRRAYADVVKSDATASMEQGERLQQRVGELREKAKVTSLLGIWQQRLQAQQQRQRAAAQRQKAVWQRQQELLLQTHKPKAVEEIEMANLARYSPAAGVGTPRSGTGTPRGAAASPRGTAAAPRSPGPNLY